MSHIKTLIFGMLFACSTGMATTYWVDDNGAAANLAACSGATPLSGTAACSYDKANGSGVVAGDTVYYRTGTYNISGIYESGIRPTNSGTNGNRITLKAYNSESVSFVGISGAPICIDLMQGQDYITVDGISCTNFYHNAYLGNDGSPSGTDADYNEIVNCTFTGNPTSYHEIGWRGSNIFPGHFNWIHNNTFLNYGDFADGDDVGVPLELGWDSGTADVHDNVVEDNTFMGCGHHCVGLQGSKNVFRNNYLQNYKWDDYAGTLYGSKVLQIVGNTGVGSSLIEKNRIGYGWDSPEPQTPEGEGLLLSADYNIFRYNEWVRNYLTAVYHHSQHGATALSIWNSFYNNTIWYAGWHNNSASTEAKDYWNEIYTHGYVMLEGTGAVNNMIVNNIFYNNENSVLANQDVVNFQGELPALQDVRSNWLTATGNPKFVDITGTPDPTNATQFNFSLQSDSTAINAGTYLTTAVYKDADEITAVNAYPFQPGWGNGAGGGAVVYADWICLTTSSTVVSYDKCFQITAIDYANKYINVGAHGLPNNATTYYVWLYKNSLGEVVLSGSAPDYGAHEYTGASFSKCDINMDGSVNATDVSYLADVILGTQSSTQGDINGDSAKNILDLMIDVSVVYNGATCPQ
jgi:hypothetical protein